MRRLLLLFCLTGCTAFNSEPVQNVTFNAPRPFGYVLGDEIVHRISFDTDVSVTLHTASLPATGAINRWLNLNQVSLSQAKNDGHHYELALRYQVFYAPLEVKLLTIPGFKISLDQNGKDVSQNIPAWAFNMSPLRELSVRKTEQGEYKRPDAVPNLLQNRYAEIALLGTLVAALLSGLYLAGVYGWLPVLFKQHTFKPALQKLNKLTKNDMQQALGVIHQALNTLNRQPLFYPQLPDFYRRFPAYQQLHREWEWFFNYSNRYFFTHGMTPVAMDLEKLQDLCAAARNIEQERL